MDQGPQPTSGGKKSQGGDRPDLDVASASSLTNPKAKPGMRKSPTNLSKPVGIGNQSPSKVSQGQKDKARATVETQDKEIESAQRLLSLEANKELSSDILGVRSAVSMLTDTIQTMEAKIKNIEHSREVAAPRRDMAAEDWLANLIRHVEEQIWQSMERRVEEKVRMAVAKATEEVANSVKELAGTFGVGRNKTDSSEEDSDSSGDGRSKKISGKKKKGEELDFGNSNSLFPEDAPGLKEEKHAMVQKHLSHEKRMSIHASSLAKRASVRNSRIGESLGLTHDGSKMPPVKEDEPKVEAPKKKPVPATEIKAIHVHKQEAITKMLHGEENSDEMFKDIPKMLEEPQNWGIRVREIKRFYDYIKDDLNNYVQTANARGEKNIAINLHTVTPRFIKPWTEAYKPHPLAGVMNADSLCSVKTSSLEEIFTARIFISHCWNENFSDFVHTMSTILEPEDVVWVCAISICQNVDIQAILGERIEDSPFWRAMPHCRRVAMLIDRKAEPFERAWCALEEYLATYKLRLPFSICMPDMDEEAWREVDNKLQNFSIRECKASEPSDLKKIMDIIEDKADIIDRVVRDESQKACFAARVMKLATSGKVQDLIPMAMLSLTQVHDGAGRSLLHVCAQNNKFEQLKNLLEHNLPTNQRDGAGKAPLHYASELGNIEVAKVLLGKKADVNVKDKVLSTPLSLAARKGMVNMVPLLVDSKAFPNMRDSEGLTPLMTATCEGQDEVVKQLIKCGANLKVKDSYGHSALTLAAQAANIKVVEMLLEGKSDVNAQDDDGATPLMYAAGFGYTKVLVTLLNAKADTKLMDNQDYMAVDFAKEDNHQEIIKILQNVK